MVTRTTTPRTGDIKVPGPTCELHGRTYELFGTKLQDKSAGLFDMKRKCIHSFYMATSGADLDNTSLKSELKRLANFPAVKNARMLAARLELLQIEAKGRHELKACDFQIVPEVNNVGCGFIPVDMLKRLAGAKLAESRVALQVRIVCTKARHFLGCLVCQAGH